jgi:ribosomal protein S12 methylthiotransferase accessory factor
MDNHWKNCAPEETVNKIEKILQDLGIDLCVEWMVDHNPLQVYSNKISIFNQSPNLKTGGKGITPNYAKASGYAEFIERLQTFMLFYRDYDMTVFKDEEYDNEIQSCICPYHQKPRLP